MPHKKNYYASHLPTIIFIVLSIVAFLPLPSCRIVKAPEYRAFKDLNLSQVGLKESSMTLQLVFFNPNPFGFKVRNFTADIYLNQTYLGKTGCTDLIHVAKKSDFSIPLEIKINMKNLPLHTLNLLLKKNNQVSISGVALVGVRNIFREVPIRYEGDQEIKLF